MLKLIRLGGFVGENVDISMKGFFEISLLNLLEPEGLQESSGVIDTLFLLKSFRGLRDFKKDE